MGEFRGLERRASLEVLRAEASQELETVIHERLLAGEDPWQFMEELPTVDELVVYLLRAEAIAANDDDLLVLFSATGPISKFGAWGLREYAGQPRSDAPMLDAVLTALGH